MGAKVPVYALQHRHAEKWQRYMEVMAFRTTAFKVLEGMNDSTAGTVMRLGQSLARAGGKEKKVARCLFQHLSILLMRGSSSLILSGSHVSH